MTTAANTTTFCCVFCKDTMPLKEMSSDPKSHGWCNSCDQREKKSCECDEENDRDGWDDEDSWEDPAVTHERERGEAFQDRLNMWRREY